MHDPLAKEVEITKYIGFALTLSRQIKVKVPISSKAKLGSTKLLEKLDP